MPGPRGSCTASYFSAEKLKEALGISLSLFTAYMVKLPL